MATNRRYAETNNTLENVAVLPAAAKSGDPVLFGKIPGTALIDADAGNKTVMQTDGVFLQSVHDSVGGGIAAGDILYMDAAGNPKLSNDNTKVRYGYAMAAVGVGLTATIEVRVTAGS